MDCFRKAFYCVLTLGFCLSLKGTIFAADSGVSKKLLRADALSFSDKLEEAEKLYREVLSLEPDNLDAQNNLARAQVWKGYHKKGEGLYQAILAKHPDNVDAIEGLAFACHWDGRDDLAVKELERLLAANVKREEVDRLYAEIKGHSHLHLSNSNRYSYDSNKLEIMTDTIHGGRIINDTFEAGSRYSWYLFRQPGKPAVNAHRAGLDLSSRLNDYLQANSFLYVTEYSKTDFTPFTTNTWLTLKPDDIWRFDLSFDRETFEDITAIQRGIVVNSGAVSFDWRPDRFWLFSARYKRSSYSDENNQNTAFSRLEYRFSHKPYAKLYYNYYFSDWSEQRDNGYFNPRSIQSHTLGIYSSKEITGKLFLEAQTSMGYEWQSPKSNHPTYFGGLGLSYRIWPNWVMTARGEYFNALDTNPKKGYSKKTAWLGLAYSFGPEPSRTYQGTQPARPASP